jgi:hypothetical protein
MALHWLPIKYRCRYKLLLYTFKVLTEHAPVYLQELLTIHVPTRSLRTENSMLVVLSFAGDKSRRSVLDPLKFRKHIVVDTIKNSVSSLM